MLHWSDDAIVLSARRHGETSIILALLTRAHGRHLGLVRGGAGRRARGVYEAGNRVQADWRARLAEHLGHYSCELIEARAADLLDDRERLAALSAAVAVVDAALPEREPHARLHDALDGFIAALRADVADWPQRYVRFELALLADLGFGLDLASCAATGATADLAFVSPKSGRAVSRAAGDPYAERLLPLPAFLAGGDATPAGIIAGLELTGHFLARHLFQPAATATPPARARLLQRLRGRMEA